MLRIGFDEEGGFVFDIEKLPAIVSRDLSLQAALPANQC
jgi:hypothetical protein